LSNKEIIALYLSGIGSTTICKLIPNTTKREILKIIKDNNLLRDRKIPKEFYDNFYFENDKWWCKKHAPSKIKEREGKSWENYISKIRKNVERSG
jgi:hypothetical protein